MFWGVTRCCLATIISAIIYISGSFHSAKAWYYDQLPAQSCGFSLYYAPMPAYDGVILYIRDARTNQLWSSRIAYPNARATIHLYDQECFRRYKISAMPVRSLQHLTSGDPYDATILWLERGVFRPRGPAPVHPNAQQGRYYFSGWPLRGDPLIKPNGYVNFVFPAQFQPASYRTRHKHACPCRKAKPKQICSRCQKPCCSK